MKKIWSLLLAYLFLSVYVVNAQHAFEHVVEGGAHHSCLQCLQIAKTITISGQDSFQLNQAEVLFQEFISFYSFNSVKQIPWGNVSKRGPPALTT